MLANESPEKYFNECLHLQLLCLHPNLKVKIRWNCYVLSPQFEIQNTYQVQTVTKMGSHLLSRFMNPQQTFQWTRSQFRKCNAKPSFISEYFSVSVVTAVSAELAPFTFSLFHAFVLFWGSSVPSCCISDCMLSLHEMLFVYLSYYSL